MSVPLATPQPPAGSPWLALAARLGRIALGCLMVQSFLQLLAPLFFLASLPQALSTSDRAGALIALLSDPGQLLAIADLLAILGFVILAACIALIVLGLVRGVKPAATPALALGLLVLACLIALVPAMLYAQARARGTFGSLDAIVASGGWSLASVLLLAASLAYLFLTLRLEAGNGRRRLSSLRWPVYAAVNLAGSVAIAGFFQGAAAGAGNLDAFTLGLVLKVSLIPILGVIAYRDLLDRFPHWAKYPFHAGVEHEVPPPPPAAEAPPPPPPPPPDEPLPIPPPPDD